MENCPNNNIKTCTPGPWERMGDWLALVGPAGDLWPGKSQRVLLLPEEKVSVFHENKQEGDAVCGENPISGKLKLLYGGCQLLHHGQF